MPIKVLKVITEGDKKTKPIKGQTVEITYIGKLKNGMQEFDSSFRRNKPLKCVVGVEQLNQGLDEAVLNMTLGEKIEVEISHDLAYGEYGAGGVIPPNADLVYEVQLLTILPNPIVTSLWEVVSGIKTT